MTEDTLILINERVFRWKKYKLNYFFLFRLFLHLGSSKPQHYICLPVKRHVKLVQNENLHISKLSSIKTGIPSSMHCPTNILESSEQVHLQDHEVLSFKMRCEFDILLNKMLWEFNSNFGLRYILDASHKIKMELIY